MRLTIIALALAALSPALPALAAPAKLPLAHAFAASRDGMYPGRAREQPLYIQGEQALAFDIDRSMRSCRLVTVAIDGGARPYTLSIGRDHGRAGIDWLLEADDVGALYDWTVEADRGWDVIVQVTDARGDVAKRTFDVLPGSTACLRRI